MMKDYFINTSLLLLALLFVVTKAESQHIWDKYNNLKSDTLSSEIDFNCNKYKALPNTVFAVNIKNKNDTLHTTFDQKKQCYSLSKKEQILHPKIIWTYRRLPHFLIDPIFKNDSLRLFNNAPLNAENLSLRNKQFAAIESELGGINYTGSFGRGIRIGNNQNLVLDSHLDLQINGDLGDGLFLNAAISDQNIPIQPQGNTVQLQEIDQIFINVKKNNHSLTAGDFYSQIQSKRWLSYNKKLQGLSYRYVDSNFIKKAFLNLSIDRGKFARTKLQITDGNQGPYRMTGQLNEPFVTIISGTERVYCDGEKLTRGINNDYTIDYNRGEITFMPKRLINQQQRIIIEYEYINQIYLSTFLAGGLKSSYKAWDFEVNVTQRQDGLSSTNFELSDDAKSILTNTKDAEQGVYVPSQQEIKELSASPAVYYKKHEPSPCGDLDSIYIFFNSTDSTAQKKYNVTFTYVGEGNGDYLLDTISSINGNKYVFIQRNSNCEKQGNYDAIRLISTPKNLQNITFSSSFKDSTTSFDYEIGLSNYNSNRFNPESIKGYSNYLSAEKKYVRKKTSYILSMTNELVSANFKTPTPWRVQEFNREWSLGNIDKFNEEKSLQSLSAFTGKISRKKTTLDYKIEHLFIENKYNGIQNKVRLKTRYKNWVIEEIASIQQARRNSEQTNQLSNLVNLKRNWKRSEFETEFKVKHAKNYNIYSDITESGVFQYLTFENHFQQYIKDSLSYITFEFRSRFNRISPSYNQLSKWANELTINHHSEFKTHKFDLSATYRNQTPFASEAEAKQYYLGRVQHRYFNPKSKWLLSQTSLTLGSGQERRISFGFLQVQQGLGQYQWVDFNKNGIQEIDEFQISSFPDSALYIKIAQPTSEFVQTNSLSLSQTLNISLNKIKKAPKFIKKWSNQNTFNIKRNALKNAGIKPLVEFNKNSLDTLIVGEQLNFRSSLYYNRGQYALNGVLEKLITRSKTFSQQGVQFLSSTKNRLYLSTPIGDFWNTSIETNQVFKGLNFGFSTPNNYNLEIQTIKPEVSYLPNRNLKINLFTSLKKGSQTEIDSILLRSNALGLELDFNVTKIKDKRFRALQNTTLKVNFSWINNSYNGSQNTTAAYVFLEGLSTGENYVWQINLNKRLGKSLQLNFSYQGRRTGTSKKIIHNGQAQINAIF